MKLAFPLCLSFLPILAACETTRYPTPVEMFSGQAIVSFFEGVGFSTLNDHLKGLNTPINVIGGDLCQGPTTDEIVEAVNGLVRRGRPPKADELYLKEDFSTMESFLPSGTSWADIVGTLMIDSQGRALTIGVISRDFDGGLFVLNDDIIQELERLTDKDTDAARVECRKISDYFNSLETLPPKGAAAPLIVRDIVPD
jgi:hypothetical protein